MKVEKVCVSKINPAPFNPRLDLQPGDPEYEKIKRSLSEFGLVEPLVLNERTGNLVGGHQRLKVLLEKGVKEVECVVVDLSPAREKALNIALNRVQGAWDEKKLADLLGELQSIPDFNIELTGFDLPEVSELLDRVLAPESVADDNFDIEQELAAIEEPETKPGEILKLGRHRVLCRDATNEEDVARLMGDRQASLVLMDPPYAVGYTARKVVSERNRKVRQLQESHWDEMSPEEYERLLLGSLRNAQKFSDDHSALYLWFASARITNVLSALQATKWEIRNLIVWVKNTFAGSLFAQYKHQYEPLFYCFKKGKSPRWYGPNNEVTVWECDKPHRNLDHPTVKPISLFARATRNSSIRGNIVLDLFLGSGTTLIASEQLGRVCYGTEIEPRYCDLIRRRYENAVATKTEGK